MALLGQGVVFTDRGESSALRRGFAFSLREELTKQGFLFLCFWKLEVHFAAMHRTNPQLPLGSGSSFCFSSFKLVMGPSRWSRNTTVKVGISGFDF